MIQHELTTADQTTASAVQPTASQPAPALAVGDPTEADNGRPAAPPALANGRDTGAGVTGQNRDSQPVLGRAEARPVAADPMARQIDLA